MSISLRCLCQSLLHLFVHRSHCSLCIVLCLTDSSRNVTLSLLILVSQDFSLFVCMVSVSVAKKKKDRRENKVHRRCRYDVLFFLLSLTFQVLSFHFVRRERERDRNRDRKSKENVRVKFVFILFFTSSSSSLELSFFSLFSFESRSHLSRLLFSLPFFSHLFLSSFVDCFLPETSFLLLHVSLYPLT